MLDLTVTEALAKAEHLKALGETTIYLYRDAEKDFPFDKVTRVEEGNSWRLNGPTSCYLFAEIDGLTFKLNFDFEMKEADGRAVSMFDRDKLRDLFNRIPPGARQSFAELLETKCLNVMANRTNELRNALKVQADSEDCVRGLIAYARQKEAA